MRDRMPANPAEAVSELTSIHWWAEQKEWRRAARVWAFVREYGVSGVVAFGIPGLRTPSGVSRYGDIWQEAIDAGFAQPVTWAEEYDVPDAEAHPFPHTGKSEGLRGKLLSRAPAPEKAEAIFTLIDRNPELEEIVMRAFVQRAGRDPVWTTKVNTVFEEHHPRPMKDRHAPSALGTLGVSSTIYGWIKRKRDEVGELIAFLRELHMRDPEQADSLAREEIEVIREAKALLTVYENELLESVDAGVDETFARLVRSI